MVTLAKMAEQSNSIRRGLPRGRNALDREAVAASQQARLLQAICELTAREGYGSITVNKLIARAGVAKPTFYEHFDSKEACLFVWLDRAVQQLIDAIAEERRARGATTEERIRQGVTAVVEFMAADEDRARSMLVGVLRCRAAASRSESIEAYEQLAHFYQALREESRLTNPEDPPMSIVRARAIVGAIKDPLAGVLRDGECRRRAQICDEVVDGVTLLAVGHHA